MAFRNPTKQHWHHRRIPGHPLYQRKLLDLHQFRQIHLVRLLQPHNLQQPLQLRTGI